MTWQCGHAEPARRLVKNLIDGMKCVIALLIRLIHFFRGYLYPLSVESGGPLNGGWLVPVCWVEAVVGDRQPGQLVYKWHPDLVVAPRRQPEPVVLIEEPAGQHGARTKASVIKTRMVRVVLGHEAAQYPPVALGRADVRVAGGPDPAILDFRHIGVSGQQRLTVLGHRKHFVKRPQVNKVPFNDVGMGVSSCLPNARYHSRTARSRLSHEIKGSSVSL